MGGANKPRIKLYSSNELGFLERVILLEKDVNLR